MEGCRSKDEGQNRGEDEGDERVDAGMEAWMEIQIGVGVEERGMRTRVHMCQWGYGHYLTFLLPFSDPSGHSFTVQKSIPGTFCTFSINRRQTNNCVTVLVLF